MHTKIYVCTVHCRNRYYLSPQRPYFDWVELTFVLFLQLDWTSCAETHKINFPRDQEGYDGFEYTDEKLSTRRITYAFFGKLILEK